MTEIYIKRAFSLCLLALIFSSCNPGTYRPLFNSRNDRVIDTLRYVHIVNSKSPASDIYRIRPGDMLSIKNIKISDIEDGGIGGGVGGQGGAGQGQGGGNPGGLRVERDGTVTLPTVGKVTVMDLTEKEATDKIQGLYKASLLKDPVIVVTVSYPKVSVLGEVSNQGVYPLQGENTNVAQVIALAGGFTTRVNPKTLRIFRGDMKDPEVIYVNLENLASLANPKTILQNNDIIYVGADQRYSAYEKSQSGFGIFQSIVLVLSTGILIYSTFFK